MTFQLLCLSGYSQDLSCMEKFNLGDQSYQKAEYSSAIQYFKAYLNCSAKDASSNRARAWLRMGGAYTYLSELDSAKSNLALAKETAKAAADTFLYSYTLLEQAVVLQQEGDFEESAKLLLEAIELNKLIGADSINTKNYVNLAMNFGQVGNLELDKKYNLLALESARKFKQEDAIFSAALGLAGNYHKENQQDSVKLLLEEALAIGESSNLPINTAYVYLNKATYLKDEDKGSNYLKAINTPGIPLYDKTNFQAFYALFLNETGQFQQARRVAFEAMETCDSIGTLQLKVDILPILMDAQVGLGRYKAAYETSQTLKILEDSIYSQDLKNQIHELNIKYETALKEKENQKLIADNATKDLEIQKYKGQTRQRTLIAIILLVGLCSLLFMWFQSRRITQQDHEILRRENKLKEEELERVSREKELAILSAKLDGEEKERSRIARELHDGIGALLANIKLSLSSKAGFNVQSTSRLVDRTSSELREIAQNLSPTNLKRFGLLTAVEDICNDMTSEKTTIHFQPLNIDESSLENIKYPVYRVIQELVTNCVRHAEASEAIVQLSKAEDRLHIVVEDNGKGFQYPIPNEHKHLGLANIKHRLAQINGRMEIDSIHLQGTTINIEIPLAL